MKNKKITLLNNRLNASLKHLRGQHNQLDHAWNRGMGGGGSSGLYGPGYMNTQQFLELKASLQAQIAAGSITQEEGEATWTAVQRIHNEDYDNRKRTEQELSRRESSVETLANRRRNRNQRVTDRFSARDIMLTAENTTLANFLNYRGEDFYYDWLDIKTDNFETMTDEQKDYLDQKVLLDNNEIQSYWSFTNAGRHSKNTLAFMVRGLAKSRDIVKNANMSRTMKKYLQELLGPSESVGTYEDIEQLILDELDYFGAASATRTPSSSISYIQERLDKLIENFKKADEFNWEITDDEYNNLSIQRIDNPLIDAALGAIDSAYRWGSPSDIKKYIKETIKRAELAKQLLQPSVFRSIHDLASSSRPAEAIELLSQNRFPFYSTLATNMRQWDAERNEVKDENDLRVAIAALAIPNMIGTGTQMDDAALQQILDTLKSSPNIYNGIKNDIGQNGNDEYRVLDSDMYIPMSSDDLDLPGALQRMQYKNIAYGLLRDEMRQGVVDRIGEYRGQDISDDQKASLLKFFERKLNDYYSSVGKYRTNLNGTIEQIFSPMTNQFTDPFWQSVVGISPEEQIDMHQTLSAKYNVEDFASTALGILQNRVDEAAVANAPLQDRLAMQQRIIQRQLDAARISRADVQIMRDLESKLDDIEWQIMVANNPDISNITDEEDLVQYRIQNTEPRSPLTRENLLIQAMHLRDQRYLRLNAADYVMRREGTADSALDYFTKKIETLRKDRNTDDNIAVYLADEFTELENTNPEIDLSKAYEYAITQIPKLADTYQIDQTSFDEIREKAWDGRTPKLITEDGVMNLEDSVFSSPAFEYGKSIINPIGDKYAFRDVSPDNPVEVPLFNPRSARNGAREVVEEKTTSPRSIFRSVDPQYKEMLQDRLEYLGYSSKMIGNIFKALNDSLIPAPRGADVSCEIYTYNGKVSLRFDYTYGINGYDPGLQSESPYYVDGNVSIIFDSDPTKSELENHVDYMVIPNNLGTEDDPKKNKYQGAAAPMLMYSGDELRKVGYALGSAQSYYTATAAIVRDKEIRQNSGPTTWPVLGATVDVRVNGRLIKKLLNMGYSQEFVDYVRSKGNVPSYLFFLNSPPKIFSTKKDPNNPNQTGPILIPSSPQQLWYEIYATGSVDRGFGVTLNLGSPRDPGRIYNQFIPGSKRKEYLYRTRLKSMLKQIKNRKIAYALRTQI